MTNFKAGDRVVYVGKDPEYHAGHMMGKTGSVVAADTEYGTVDVKWDDRPIPHGVYPANIEKVDEDPDNLAELRDVVSRLRAKGMTVEVSVTRTTTETI